SSNAISSASRCGPGISAVTAGSTLVSRSLSPAKDRLVSLADGSLRSSRWPAARAASIPARHSVDLPAPASPCSARPAAPARTPPGTWRTRRHSAGRTTSLRPAAIATSHHSEPARGNRAGRRRPDHQYQLGRRLAEIALADMGAGELDLTPGEFLVLQDLFLNGRSAIGDIAARTGLAQSRVSTSVRSFIQRGWAITSADPAAGRKTRAA